MAAAGMEMPPVVTPLASYVPARRSGDHIHSSGQLPLVDGELIAVGKLGATVSTADGVRAARAAALNALSSVAQVAGGVDNIARVMRVVVYVASDPNFLEQPAVANGASELLSEIFGPENGSHVRSAVGVCVLPLDAAVEVELVVEV